jgi:hypothetical protein
VEEKKLLAHCPLKETPARGENRHFTGKKAL